MISVKRVSIVESFEINEVLVLLFNYCFNMYNHNKFWWHTCGYNIFIIIRTLFFVSLSTTYNFYTTSMFIWFTNFVSCILVIFHAARGISPAVDCCANGLKSSAVAKAILPLYWALYLNRAQKLTQVLSWLLGARDGWRTS